MRIQHKLCGGMWNDEGEGEDAMVPYAPLPLAAGMEGRRDGKFKVLSIDGGGIRGIIPLTICAALERQMDAPLHTKFDLISGTSTGGIVALGLTHPGRRYPAEEILRLYQERSKEIFESNSFRGIHTAIAETVIHSTQWRNMAVSSLVDSPIYTDAGLKRIAKEILGASLMKDARTNVYIPACDVTTSTPTTTFFSNRNTAHAFFAMSDVALATSAAPMYFPRKKIRSRFYVDGGLACNNPAKSCFDYAIENGIPPENQYIVSLGTGFADIEGIGDEEERHNLLYWGRNIFSIVDRTLSETAIQGLSRSLGDRFFRLNPRMEVEIPLDDNSDDAIRQLTDIGRALVEDNVETIEQIAAALR